jgi:hypothetical protein
VTKPVKVLNVAERLVSFLGSISSIAGLLIAIPAVVAAFKIGKSEGKKENKTSNEV